jgi:uncharacterized membrane protein
MTYEILKFLHVLSVVVWVGGMAFAHFCLRPALAQLQPEPRLRLMHEVLRRFFSIVLVAILFILASGLWMIDTARRTAQAGASFHMPLNWMLMATLGIIMMAIFGHIRFALFKRFDRAVGAADWQGAAAGLASIRQWVFINLILGILVIAIALLG